MSLLLTGRGSGVLDDAEGRRDATGDRGTLSAGLRLVVPVLVASVYYLDVLRQAGIPPRLFLTGLLVLVLLLGIGPHGPLRAAPGVGYLAALAMCGAGYALTTLAGSGAVASSNAQRFLVTFPLALVAGYVLAGSRRTLDYLARVVVAVASLTAILALIEFGTGRSLLGRDTEFMDYVRDDSARAVVGAEHPLVLGVLLALAVPLAYRGLGRWSRWPVVVLLLSGVYATGSRGPLGVAVGVLALLAVPGLMRFLARHFGVVLFAVMAGLGVLWYFASKVWQPETTSMDTLANSMEYRAAIYSLMPRILVARPFGYGLGDLPAGQWLIRSPDQFQDITTTVDSQWVLSSLRLGWVGIALLIAVAVIAILALRRRLDFGLALLVLTGCGTFVALDAWDGAGTLWLLLVGVGLRLLGYPPHSLEPSATNRRASTGEPTMKPPVLLPEARPRP